MDRFGGTTARDFDLIEFSTELFASQRRNDIYASSEFVFPLLALLMVEETVRRLDPRCGLPGHRPAPSSSARPRQSRREPPPQAGKAVDEPPAAA
ncbi:hypothetical protein [Streptomyces clavuligerus]|uniref:hypothetical protein n=1 Tax=Streptomyces clavuligerus TaxID=1901 RepID=UPI001F072CCF|nr:hypothetical protein [Streptomyces clavuligerus]